jgi:hypothetical protein
MMVWPATTGAAAGKTMEEAIDLVGVMQGTLTPQDTERWYTYWDSAASPATAFTLAYFPTTVETDHLVTFTVFKPVKTFMGLISAEVGNGTVVGTQTGLKYWRASAEKGVRYHVRVQSGSPETVYFAIAQTGAVEFAPGLHVIVGGPETGVAPPEPTMAPAGPAPLSGTPTPTETRGKSATDPIPLGDIRVGYLAPYSSVWYVDNVPDANFPLGVDLNFSPATPETSQHVVLKVWTFRNTPTGPKFEMIGLGTVPSGGMEYGMLYWRGAAAKGYTAYIEVVNEWSGDIAYGIGSIGDHYPPYQLPVGELPATR